MITPIPNKKKMHCKKLKYNFNLQSTSRGTWIKNVHLLHLVDMQRNTHAPVTNLYLQKVYSVNSTVSSHTVTRVWVDQTCPPCDQRSHDLTRRMTICITNPATLGPKEASSGIYCVKFNIYIKNNRYVRSEMFEYTCVEFILIQRAINFWFLGHGRVCESAASLSLFGSLRCFLVGGERRRIERGVLSSSSLLGSQGVEDKVTSGVRLCGCALRAIVTLLDERCQARQLSRSTGQEWTALPTKQCF